MNENDVIAEARRLGHDCCGGDGGASLFMFACERCSKTLDFSVVDFFEAMRDLRKLGHCSARGFFEHRRPSIRELLEEARRA